MAQALGRVDTLVNCAAIYPRKPILEISDADWDASNAINVKGTYLEVWSDMLGSVGVIIAALVIRQRRLAVHAHGWLMVHAGVVPQWDAAQTAFGDLKVLDKELKAYLNKGKMRYLPIAADKLAVGPITIRKLSEAESAMMPIILESKRGVDEESAKVLLPKAQAVAAKYPGDPAVLAAFHGQDGIRRVVNDTVDRSAADPRISEIFKATDLVRLKRTLFEQFCFLMDGGCSYTGRDMAAAHKDMGVTGSDMNALVENLQKAMDREGVPFRVQNRLLAILAPMKRDIVER